MIKRLRTTHPLFLILVLTFFSVALFPHNSLAAKPAIKRVDPALKKALAEAVADAKSFDDQFEAEVWLVDMSARLKRFIKDPQERLTSGPYTHLTHPTICSV